MLLISNASMTSILASLLIKENPVRNGNIIKLNFKEYPFTFQYRKKIMMI